MGKDFVKKDEVKLGGIKPRKVLNPGDPVIEETVEVAVEEAVSKPKSFGGPRKGGQGQRPRKQQESDSGLIEKVVAINRTAKATKGGTRMAFSALVVVGDGKGKAGYGKRLSPS